MDFTAILSSQISFGRYPYPADEAIAELENNGYTIFIDLTTEKEKVLKYQTTKKYISYPIYDRECPRNINEFYEFLKNIIIAEGDKIYIHCRGGHGRAAVVAATLLLKLNPAMTSEQALNLVKEAHKKRPTMRPRWRKLGAPQNKLQKDFVHLFKEQDDKNRALCRSNLEKYFTYTPSNAEGKPCQGDKT